MTRIEPDPTEPKQSDKSLGDLFGDLSQEFTDLVRTQTELAKTEIRTQTDRAKQRRRRVRRRRDHRLHGVDHVVVRRGVGIERNRARGCRVPHRRRVVCPRGRSAVPTADGRGRGNCRSFRKRLSNR